MSSFCKNIAGIKVQYLGEMANKNKKQGIYIKNATVSLLENAMDDAVDKNQDVVYIYGKLNNEIISYYNEFDDIIIKKINDSNVIYVNFKNNKPKQTYKKNAKILKFKKSC
jgi:hypothetical protein